MRMGIAVCLCGTPQLPNLGGLRGGRTPNAEISVLLESLGWARQSLESSPGLWSVRQEMAGRESMDVLAGRVQMLEKLAGRRLAETDRNRRSPRGRHWAPPVREPLSGGEGKLTRDQLVLKLQERGFGFREAWRVVNAILAVMIKELQDGGKVVVENLLGKFKVVRRPAARRLVRFGREVTVNQQAKRVAFQMDPSLRGPLPSSSTSKEVRLPEAMNPKQLRCERCGSLEFTEAQFWQIVADFSSASPGADAISKEETRTFRVLVCLCGHPVMPGWLRTPRPPLPIPMRVARPGMEAARASFQQSFEAALRYREIVLAQQAVLIQALEARLAERYAPKEQYDRLAERVENLERMLAEGQRGP